MWKTTLKTFTLCKSKSVPKRWNTVAVNLGVKKERSVDPELATAKSFDEVPHETALPLIGTIWTYLPVIGKYNAQKLHEAAWKRHRQYGKIVREDIIPSMKILHISDVHDIEKTFRFEGRYPNRPGIEAFQKYKEKRKHENHGLIVESGEKWYELRSKSQKHIMRPDAIHYYLPGMDTVAKEVVQRMEQMMDSDREVPDFKDELYKWALESVALVLFNTKLNCLNSKKDENSENWKLIEAVNDIFALSFKLEMNGLKLWKRFPTPTFNRFCKAMDTFTSISTKHLNNALEKMNSSSADSNKTTLVEAFILKEGMSMGLLTTLITDLTFGGIETTSHSTAFILYHLAKNPHCQEKIYEELCRVLPDPSDPITVPVLNESRYLKASVKETMRFSPLFNGNGRILDQDIVLSGYRIPAGVIIVSENIVASHLEENFPEPTKFKPERWMRGKDVDKPSPFASLPFGFGPRSCLGRRIAEQEMWTLLIRILRKFKVEYHHEDMNYYGRFINTPDKPLRFAFLQR